jgi:proteasome lid subunit RPN8/RPN11
MIKWRDTPSDVGPVLIDALYATLSLSDVLRIESALAQPHLAEPLVIVPVTVRDRVQAHLRQSDAELGGLLIGNAYTHVPPASDERIGVICVREAIAGDDYSSTAVSLRLDASVWTKARAHLGSGRLVVGWYHSHPHIGAFFSNTDRRTQRAFFAHAYSVGWVIDPYSATAAGEEKFFLGRDAIELNADSIVTERACA